jgi:hypothetical protein
MVNINKTVKITLLIVVGLLFFNCESRNSENRNSSNATEEIELPYNFTSSSHRIQLIDTASSQIIELCGKQKEECKDFKVIEARSPSNRQDDVSEVWLINLKYSRRSKIENTNNWSDTSSWVKVNVMSDGSVYLPIQ